MGVRLPLPVQDDDAFPADDEYPSDEDFTRMAAYNADVGRYAADLAGHHDDTLIRLLAAVDEDHPDCGWCRQVGVHTPAQKTAFMVAVTAEILRRLGSYPPAALAA